MELPAGLHGDEDVLLAGLSMLGGESIHRVGKRGLNLSHQERVGPVRVGVDHPVSDCVGVSGGPGEEGQHADDHH